MFMLSLYMISILCDLYTVCVVVTNCSCWLNSQTHSQHVHSLWLQLGHFDCVHMNEKESDTLMSHRRVRWTWTAGVEVQMWLFIFQISFGWTFDLQNDERKKKMEGYCFHFLYSTSLPIYWALDVGLLFEDLEKGNSCTFYVYFSVFI